MCIYYTVYRTTNLINNKEYIGVHKTKNPNDSYLGSGHIMKKAIKQYGKDNFKKEVLFIFETEQEMVNKESELVNEEYVNRLDTYNLVSGGKYRDYYSEETKNKMCGENNSMYGKSHSQETKDNQSRFMKEMWQNEEYKIKQSNIMKERWNTPEYRDNYVEMIKEKWQNENYRRKVIQNLTGRTHSEETKKKISEANMGNKWTKEAKERFSKMLIESGQNKHTEEWKLQHSKNMTGESNPMFGKTRTTEEKLKMVANRKRGICPHCGKESTMSIITLHHLDNCKQKSLNINNEVVINMGELL